MIMSPASPVISDQPISTNGATNGHLGPDLVSGSVEPISEEKARRVLESVDFLSKLREEVVVRPALREQLLNTADLALDLPEWWVPGKHDYDLVIGAARHGLARMEYYVLNDIELSFKDVLKKSISGEPLANQKELDAWEKSREERIKSLGGENNTGLNGDANERKDEFGKGKKKLKKGRRLSGKSDISDLTAEECENGDAMDSEHDDKTEDERRLDKEKLSEDKRKAVERSAVVAPQLNLQQMEAAIAKGGGLGYDQEMINDLMAQTYAASVQWPKDNILHVRLHHIVQSLESGKWPVRNNSLLASEVVASGPATPEPSQHGGRDTSTPLSEMSELSQYDDGNVLTHGSLASRKKRGRRPLDYTEGAGAKSRAMMTNSGTPLSASSLVSSTKASTDDSMSDTSGARGQGVEITPVADESGVSGILDLKNGKGSGSKLESALDKLGLQKRKLSDAPPDDKSKKKKRLDDLLSGLHAGKGNTVPEKDSAVDSLFKKTATEAQMTDLNKLQEVLGHLGGNPADAKVQKWLADHMGVTPERPLTPGSSATATSKRPSSTSSSSAGPGWMEWMSRLSGEEHVTVFNRSTGKKLSGADAPKLKNLPQWFIENPMFEVDPKWADEVRSKEPEKKKGPGRPPLDDVPAHKVPKTASPGVGPSYNSMASLGLDPKNPMAALAALDPKNPSSLATLYGFDPKKLDPMTAAMLSLGDPNNPMKMDPMMMAALSMDPKTLQAMGIDPKKLNALAQPATSKSDPKSQSKSSASAAAANSSQIDPRLLAAFGLDPKNPKLDAMTAAALGLDPKNPKFDPMLLASLGLDPKNPNSTLLAAMAAMDPNHQLAAMYGMMPPGFPSMSGMDPYGKGKQSPSSKETGKASLPSPSPRSSSQRDGPSPRPPSRASASSRDGRSTPKSSALQTSSSQASPKSSTSNIPSSSAAMMGNLNPALFGLDPKVLASMDPKLLAAAGIDPKMLDPKTLASMMDPRMASMAGMDMKALAQMDPKVLQAAGIDPNMLSKMLDPKQMAGMDPNLLKMMDPKASQASSMSPLDPKFLASMGLDPKLLSQMDPNLLKSFGIDPKLLGLPDQSKSSSNSMDSMLKSMGIDPKALAGMDPKVLGFDPKLLTDPKMMDPKLLLGGMDPKLLGLDPKMFGMSSSPTSSTPNTLISTSSRPSNTSTFSTKTSNVNSTQMSIQSLTGDPRLHGLDPKMLQGLDEKALKSLGLDHNIVKTLIAGDKGSRSSDVNSSARSSGSSTKTNTSTTFAGLDPKMFPGVDPKLLQGMDPKMMQMMDPKTMAAMMDPKMMAQMYGIDPKMLASMDPNMLKACGIDPKWFDPKSMSQSMDPSKQSFAGIDPKLLGLDPKMLQQMDPKLLQSMGIDLKSLGMDPKTSQSSTSHPSTSNAMDASKLLAMTGLDAKTLASMDPKVLAQYGIDPKMLASLDPKAFGQESRTSSGEHEKLLKAAGYDPKMLQGMDPKVLASMGLDSKTLAAAMDPKNLAKMLPGIDPKTLAGMDPKVLASMGLDPKMLASMGMDPKSLGMDSKMSGGIDPKQLMGGMDPKMLASMGLDPKMLAGMDPKVLASMGIDPKMLGSLGMDPKMAASMGMDPKMLASMGMDPKMLASMGMDPKSLASMDPKLLASMGLDPKMLASMDPKVLASMGLDPKMMSDPNLLAMYSMGMPGMMSPYSSAPSMSNGIGLSPGTPLPSSKSTISAKPKPGTVAAALHEKKESEKARSEHGLEDHYEKHDKHNLDLSETQEEEFRRGLTSEERVLLREKKKERLMKENESDEGLNLSVSKNGGSEHTTKLEALLAKPIEDLSMPHHISSLDKGLTNSNGEPPRTEGM